MGADGGDRRSGSGADPAQAITLEKQTEWSEEAERGLSKTFGHDRELLIAGVEMGNLELWKVNSGESWMITRIEAGELIVCCYQGRRLRDVAAYLFRLCQRNRLHAIRFYTTFGGISRMLQAFGFQTCETVYRCEVPLDE